MKKYTLWVILSVLSVFIVISSIYLWYFANTKDIITAHYEKEHKIDSTKSINSGITWFKSLANFKRKTYSLPVNEIFINTGTSLSDSNIRRLIINKDDSYSMFCILQVFNNLSVKYALVKDKNENLIYFKSTDNKFLKSIIDNLKMYDIIAKTAPVS